MHVVQLVMHVMMQLMHMVMQRALCIPFEGVYGGHVV
jgi:hypothetical protein